MSRRLASHTTHIPSPFESAGAPSHTGVPTRSLPLLAATVVVSAALWVVIVIGAVALVRTVVAAHPRAALAVGLALVGVVGVGLSMRGRR